jgi:glucokinase
MGSGVGAGLVVDGRLYHGAKITEAEFGHIRLDKSGRTVEAACSGWAVDEKIRSYISGQPESLLAKLAKDFSHAQARALSPALAADDAGAWEIFRETIDDFSFALSHAVHLVNPDTVIIGGGLSLIGEPLRTEIEKKLPEYLMDVLQPGPRIQLSALNEDAVPVGAVSLAIIKLTS